MRIVSLLPSATEILCSIGLGDSLVGVSHECDYPAMVNHIPAVTTSAIHPGLPGAEIDSLVRQRLHTEKALYHLDMTKLAALRPDLIVTQALCDVCAVAAGEVEAAACALPGNPEIINLEPMCLKDVFDTMLAVGVATKTEQAARSRVDELQRRASRVWERSSRLDAANKPRVAFLEWIDPLFNAGHWTPELIGMAGGIDCLGSKHQPSRRIDDAGLIEVRPEVLFVAQCGFTAERTVQDLPRLQTITGWDDLACVKNGRLYYADGNAYFSRPGPRLVDSLEVMAHTLHPELHPLPAQLKAARQF